MSLLVIGRSQAGSVKIFCPKRLILVLTLLCCASFSIWTSINYSEVLLPKQTEADRDEPKKPLDTNKNYMYSNQIHSKFDAITKPLSPDVARFIHFAKKTAMSDEYKRHYLEIMQEFDSIWREKLGRTYHMVYGTLLGSIRHQSFIPYDDGIDLIIDRRDLPLLESEVNEKSTLAVFPNGPNKRKMFFKDYQLSRTRRWWAWPSIDIYFYRFLNNETEIQDSEIPYYKLPTYAVFPTTVLPFEGYLFPAPRCYYRAMEVTFGKDFLTKCCPVFWNHRIERYGPDPNGPCVNCQSVLDYFNVSLTPLIRETDEVCNTPIWSKTGAAM